MIMILSCERMIKKLLMSHHTTIGLRLDSSNQSRFKTQCLVNSPNGNGLRVKKIWRSCRVTLQNLWTLVKTTITWSFKLNWDTPVNFQTQQRLLPCSKPTIWTVLGFLIALPENNWLNFQSLTVVRIAPRKSTKSGLVNRSTPWWF